MGIYLLSIQRNNENEMRFLLTLAAFLLITACGGRDARPVAEYKPGDDAMTCPQLKGEMSLINTKIEVLIPKTNKTAKNTALGVTGYFLVVPLFFMDFTDSEKVEIAAYQDRHRALEMIYMRKCVVAVPA